MAQRTTADETMTRPELAEYLQNLADELERGDDEIAIGVGNRMVHLQPANNVDVSIEVIERSSKIRGQRETIELELSWKP
ncbi:amphi-Trp domain-containing protein [Salinilacihabitans rarus]|uniref:amphi-Trp domain-containing protein n=1 Tax=Salinilacihabitans rarus TaxID=2961596 RepID=UPI0020C8B67D|nr:amphi-Trp domain-containing protein [Salinilacihabitans rarus]